jgi:DNA helicase HerA-like ATPase
VSEIESSTEAGGTLTDAPIVGLVDGAIPATTDRFTICLNDDAVVQLDDLVCLTNELPDGRTVSHYGIVVDQSDYFEGAQWATDTARIAVDQTQPGERVRRVDVQVLRTIPELWIAPAPGSIVRRAAGATRDAALFCDQMDQRLAVGLDQSGQPVYADWSFLSGQQGGHVNITGISGVATKTSYATFLLYSLLETQAGRDLLGQHAPNTRALVFNAKGEDLLHLDRPNRRFDAESRERWGALGVSQPGPFSNVEIFVPRQRSAEHAVVPDIESRAHGEVSAYGWTPWDFIRLGLLRFCFTEDEDRRTQVGFVEQRVRVQLARYAYPHQDGSGAVVIAAPPAGTGYTFERVVEAGRQPRNDADGTVIRDFHDLIEEIGARCDLVSGDPDWQAGAQGGTLSAFVRRLMALTPRMGHLVAVGLPRVELNRHITVVDIHKLHEAAQRFVVGALLNEIFESKQGTGREPLRFVLLDELNKYAPRAGHSPIKELLVDIAERGRSLGVLLIGAQQSALDVDAAIVRNASLKVAGRLDANEASEYRFLTPELRQRAARFLPGTMVIDQPIVPAPIPIRFPFPPFATNVSEAGSADPEADARQVEESIRMAQGEAVD